MATKSYALTVGKHRGELHFNNNVNTPLGSPSIAGRVSTNFGKRQVLVLNSHSLSDYQVCPQKYDFLINQCITTVHKRKVFELGTFWGKMLEIYYRYKIDYEPKYTAKQFLMRLEILVKRMKRVAENEDNGFTEEERNLLGTRILLYFKTYQAEKWKPVGVEVGFSIILYQDKHVVFIYEGRPDRYVKIPNPFRNGELVLAISDDKTRAKNVDLLTFCNQVFGYLLAAKTNWFIYNYMGKQMEGGPQKYFQRQVVHYTDAQLADWKRTTIQWYHRILSDINKRSFLKSYQCSGMYSNCQFLRLCEAKDKIEYQGALNTHFEILEEARKSW